MNTCPKGCPRTHYVIRMADITCTFTNTTTHKPTVKIYWISASSISNPPSSSILSIAPALIPIKLNRPHIGPVKRRRAFVYPCLICVTKNWNYNAVQKRFIWLSPHKHTTTHTLMHNHKDVREGFGDGHVVRLENPLELFRSPRSSRDVFPFAFATAAYHTTHFIGSYHRWWSPM